nr:hypothetical protein [Tanacetum cinerariifolium]
MADLPPLNNDSNVSEGEHALAHKHAPISPNPAPIQLNDYLANNKEPEEEEEPIHEQAPAAPDGFAPYGLVEDDKEIEEKDDEEIEEEDDEEIEDEEEKESVAKDKVEIIYPYDEADSDNRPPLTLNDEYEFAPSVIPVFDAKSIPDIYEVYLFGLVPLTIGTAMKRIRRMNEQIHDRAEVDERIVKKIGRSDLRIRMVGRDAMSLDGAVRECQAVFKVISMMENDDVEDDDIKDDDDMDDDMDDDAADPSDPYYNYTNGIITYSLLFLCRVRIMAPKQMSQAAIAKLVADKVAKALAADRATRNTTGAGGSSNVGGEEGAIELCCWFEKIKFTFGISESEERNKVKFVAPTLQGRALTGWNTQVATLGLVVANKKSWDDLKR